MARLQMAYDVRDIGAIQKRWVSLKDLMFFVDELPNLVDLMEDYETNLYFYRCMMLAKN